MQLKLYMCICPNKIKLSLNTTCVVFSTLVFLEQIYIYIYIYTHIFISIAYVYVYIHIYIYI